MSDQTQIQELNQKAWQMRHTDRKASEALSRQALELAQARGDELEQGFAWRSIAHGLVSSGQAEQSLEMLTQALEIGRRHHNQMLERDSLNLLAGVYSWFGDLEQAVDLVSQAYRLSLDLQDHATISACLNNICVMYHQLGQHLTALEYAQEAIERAIVIGDRVRQAISLSNAAVACGGLLRFAEGLATLEQSQVLSKELGLEELHLRNRVNRIEHLIGLGQLEEALSEVTSCLEILRGLGIPEGEAQCLLFLGHIQLAQAAYNQAEHTASQALEIAAAGKMRGLEASIRKVLAQAHKGLEHFELALEYTGQAQEIEAQMRTEGAHRRMRTLSKLNLVDRLESVLRLERSK